MNPGGAKTPSPGHPERKRLYVARVGKIYFFGDSSQGGVGVGEIENRPTQVGKLHWKGYARVHSPLMWMGTLNRSMNF